MISLKVSNEVALSQLRGHEVQATSEVYAQDRAVRGLPVISVITFQPDVFKDPDITRLKKHTDVFREALHMSCDSLNPAEIEKLRLKKTNGRSYYDDSPHFEVVPYANWDSERIAAQEKTTREDSSWLWEAKERVFVHDGKLAELVGRDAQGRNPAQPFDQTRYDQLYLEFDQLPEVSRPSCFKTS